MRNCAPGHEPLQEALAAILHCCLALRAVLLPDDVLCVLYQTEVDCWEVLLCKGGVVSLVASLAACRVSELFTKHSPQGRRACHAELRRLCVQAEHCTSSLVSWSSCTRAARRQVLYSSVQRSCRQ